MFLTAFQKEKLCFRSLFVLCFRWMPMATARSTSPSSWPWWPEKWKTQTGRSFKPPPLLKIDCYSLAMIFWSNQAQCTALGLFILKLHTRFVNGTIIILLCFSEEEIREAFRVFDKVRSLVILYHVSFRCEGAMVSWLGMPCLINPAVTVLAGF